MTMLKGGNKMLRKEDFFKRFQGHITRFSKVLLITADNVGSHQLQKVRASLRGQAVMLMGKNTLIRKCIKQHSSSIKGGGPSPLEALLPQIKGNVGFVFTNDDSLVQVANKLSALKVKAPAKAGMIAPCDVTVPAGLTGLDPSKTSFFHAVSISTKISRSAIEISKDVHLIKAGTKVTPSQATLLQMLNIQPFQFSLDVKCIFADGHVMPPSMLVRTDGDVLSKLMQGVANIAAIGLHLGIPSSASVPGALSNGYRDILSVALGTNCSFPDADRVKYLLANPQALAVATPEFGSLTSGNCTFGQRTDKSTDQNDVDPDEDIMGAGGLFGDEDEASSEEDDKDHENFAMSPGGLFGNMDDDEEEY